VLASIAVLCEARAANVGGPERFLFAGGTVLVGWIGGLAFVRAARGDREAEERGAELGAIAALAAMYVNAGAQKLLTSGLGWADGDGLRLLILSQREVDGGTATAWLADLAISSRELPLALAVFTELAQLSAIAYPFHPRARAVVGTAILAFHAGVDLLTPISFPQAMALLVIFSYPWRGWLERRGIVAPDSSAWVLARRPMRGLVAIAAGALALAGIARIPPVRELITSLSHVDGASGRPPGDASPPARPPQRPPAFAAEATALGLSEGERIGRCTLVEAIARDGELAVRFACDDGVLVIDVVETGARPGDAPRRAAGRDLFYRRARAEAGETEVAPETRDAMLDAIASRLSDRR
ncbi:MAG: hypothetical protein M3Y87_22350, partial [Myxococcota bacterium]|nr:hypothetical protein [Myxococcota bacterium]